MGGGAENGFFAIVNIRFLSVDVGSMVRRYTLFPYGFLVCSVVTLEIVTSEAESRIVNLPLEAYLASGLNYTDPALVRDISNGMDITC